MPVTQPYQHRITELETLLAVLKKTGSRIAWARLAIIIVMVFAAWRAYPYGLAPTALICMALLAAFARLVLLAADNKTAISHTQNLVAVNEVELTIAAGNFSNLPTVPPPHGHDYAEDLDIFGRASLYQYINRTVSEQGSATLSDWLLQPASVTTIVQRQEAVQELAPELQWRQELQAYGAEQPITAETDRKVAAWLHTQNRFRPSRAWLLLKWLYPAATLTMLALYIAGVLPASGFYGLLIAFIAFSSFISKQIAKQYLELNKIVPEISVLANSAAVIEKAAFNGERLRHLQQYFLGQDSAASKTIRRLKAILDRFDYRLNPLVFIPLNAFLLWDLQLIFQLEHWKSAHGSKAAHWFEALGEMEALSSLAAIRFNHSNWALPQMETKLPGCFRAEALGHPLVAEAKRVCSNFATSGYAQLSLITGSNMAGKSTFLRSAGVNLVLAMAGAPVCAARLIVSPMQVISSMRVADNLEESTSTFYAELKKLKRIIEAVNNGEKVFVLLDEILRGTNSLDRHKGSEALVKQLLRHGAVGMLATHDLDLAALANAFPENIRNYHFDVQVNGEELYFDYRLKQGVCQSMNASVLMRKIGIEV